MDWLNMDRERLISVQKELKKKLVLKDGFSEISLVGGADISYDKETAFCTVAVLDYLNMELIEECTKKYEIKFPYVPTFLSFREADPIVKTFRSLRKKPEVLLVDGQGIAHPRGIGLAAQVGVLLETPTIGVAKKILVGGYDMPGGIGVYSRILYDGRAIGFALNSRKNSKPIFVSPGHLVSLEKSLEVVKGCIKGHRLPEPLRLAHELSSKAKRLLGSSVASRC